MAATNPQKMGVQVTARRLTPAEVAKARKEIAAQKAQKRQSNG